MHTAKRGHSHMCPRFVMFCDLEDIIQSYLILKMGQIASGNDSEKCIGQKRLIPFDRNQAFPV